MDSLLYAAAVQHVQGHRSSARVNKETAVDLLLHQTNLYQNSH